MDRREFMCRSAGILGLSFAALPSAWASIDANAPRVLFVLLRGGMDGLAAVPPVGDAEYNKIRPNIAISESLGLNKDFALHPSLPALHALWGDGQLAVVHSTGFNYTGRSHFEGQDVMQTGVMQPYAVNSGWVGRAMEKANMKNGVAISIPMPLILRGNDRATTEFPNWMPMLRESDSDLVADIWADDPTLSPYSEAIRVANLGGRTRGMGKESFQNAKSMRGLALVAAAQMRAEDGPRVGLVDMRNGFDTHAAQGAESGAHANRLGDLDQLIATYREAMGTSWNNTLIVTVTEFGRTVAENGTNGTDHGVGTCCFIAGGLVTGSKVYADWRGLQKKHLLDERDLPPTIDISSVYAKVTERVFGISGRQISDGGVLTFEPNPALNGLLGLD